MTTHSPSLRLGILNMTISFDQATHTKRAHQRTDSHSLKHTLPVPGFVQTYRSHNKRHQTLSQKKTTPVTTYQSYRQSQKASIRYYREPHELGNHSGNILGIVPETDKGDFNRSFTEEETVGTSPNRPVKATKLRFSINKKHLREFSFQGQEFEGNSNIGLRITPIPADSLNNIFTVRPMRTSFRTKRETNQNSARKRHANTRQEERSKHKLGSVKAVQNPEKTIRPWSPIKNPFSRELMVDSGLLQSNYPN